MLLDAYRRDPETTAPLTEILTLITIISQ